MEQCVVKFVKMVGYVSVGIVEYLYSQDGSFYFLELNFWLQVEYFCIEMVVDVNFFVVQFQIVMGIFLYRIKDICMMYGVFFWGDFFIDFEDFVYVFCLRGYVIVVWIISENLDEGFKFSLGIVQELNFCSNKNVWGYFSVVVVGGFYEFVDFQFGYCFFWGENREEVILNMVVVLKELFIWGDF